MTETRQCPNCSSSAVSEHVVKDEFLYGVTVPGRPPPVLLSAQVPVLHCKSCGEQWTDWRGEEARQRAVNVHLQRRRAPNVDRDL